MRYFELSQDLDVPFRAGIVNTIKIGGYDEAKQGDFYKLDNAIVSLVDSEALDSTPDILDRQLFMIKGAVKEVFDMFLPRIQYKHCIMTERVKKRYERYYIPLLEVFGEDDSIETVAEGRHIFRIVNEQKNMVVASLEVIEALLRRNPIGVKTDVLF